MWLEASLVWWKIRWLKYYFLTIPSDIFSKVDLRSYLYLQKVIIHMKPSKAKQNYLSIRQCLKIFNVKQG